MPALRIRWSEQEARKPYARPFMVSFTDDAGAPAGAVAVSGADLLYYRQFQVAVLALGGELFVDGALFVDEDVARQLDTQAAWLVRLSALLPPAQSLKLHPISTFDHERGRVFHIEARIPERPEPARLEAQTLFEYQELQAGLAHQTGCLYRNPAIEGIADPEARQRAWCGFLGSLLERPDQEEAMTKVWPWRPQPAL
jgi:hypothetical protein